ncbi:MAG: hypothetical protein MUO40_14700 [Anaerolineaceae bacterium]|nr:hypothetical protein [Anaerolineaceae bacterium]
MFLSVTLGIAIRIIGFVMFYRFTQVSENPIILLSKQLIITMSCFDFNSR